MIKDFNQSKYQFYKLKEAELNRELFLHKTMVFIPRHDIPDHYNTSKNICKLFVTEHGYFSKEDIVDVLMDNK